MIFITLAIIAIILYIKEYKIFSMFILFFFITSGFNFVPSEISEFFFISKGMDYAFIIFFGIFILDIVFIKGFLKLDNITKFIFIFLIFLFACILHSKFYIGLSWMEIFRTSRYLFFWLAYLIFRNMDKSQLENLLKCLFNITLFTSLVYLTQIIISKNILVEHVTAPIQIFGLKLYRFYNQPYMIYFFAVMALYANPYKGLLKNITSIILIVTLFGGFHRSMIGFFILIILLNYFIKLTFYRKIITVGVTALLILVLTSFLAQKLSETNTFIDLQIVVSGDVADADIDLTELRDATFTFRIAHFLERNMYLVEHPKSMIWGAGLIPEDSKKVDALFDFKVGLIEELTSEVVQLDTADISYSTLILRLGYLGTFLNLLLFIYLAVFFYKNRKSKYGAFSVLYIIYALGISFFSSILVLPVTFLLPLISYCIIRKEKESKETCNNLSQ